MSIPVHIVFGILIGKLTGDYPTSLIAATAIDLDHGFSYIRHGLLLQPKELWKTMTTEKDPWSTQRNIFHNVLMWAAISGCSFFWGTTIGLAVTLGYLSHLILDALDTADYFPFYPNTRINLRGPVRYLSIHEVLVMALLAGIYMLA